jgi:hypothetical protein
LKKWRRGQHALERGRIALVGPVSLGRDHGIDVEIDGVLVRPASERFLPLRARSRRIRSSAVGLSMPLCSAIRVSIWR